MKTARRPQNLLFSFIALTYFLGVSSDVNAQDDLDHSFGAEALPRDAEPIDFTIISPTPNEDEDRVCPTNFSRPATEWEVECKAGLDRTRCIELSAEKCATYNKNAYYTTKVLSYSAYNWLETNGFCAIAIGDELTAICPKGCFEGATELMTLTPEGLEGTTLARDISELDTLAGLTSSSSLTKPELTSRSIRHITQGPEASPLYVFSLENGRELAVTQHHGMVLADGRVIEAQDVESGDLFVDIDGNNIKVQEISRRYTDEDVYNFRVNANDAQGHIIVAEGILVGDLSWQNELVAEMASIRLRK